MQKIALLYDASQAVLSTFDLDEVLRQILTIAQDFFHAQNVAVLLLEKESQELVVRRQVGRQECNLRVPLGKGLTGMAAAQKRPIYSPDVSRDPRYIPSHQPTRSEVAVPLMVRNEVLGVLDCQSDRLDYFDPETIDLLTLFSTQASMALQNAHLYSLERRRAQQLQAINTIAQQMTVVLELNELLHKVCLLIGDAFNVDHVSVLLKEENELVLRAQEGKLTLNRGESGRFPSHQGAWKEILAHDSTLVENEILAQDRRCELFQQAQSRVRIPLVSFGQTLGVLELDSLRPHAFEATDEQPLESVADICATAIQNAQHVERVRQLAYIDGLTGIFNRRFFEMRILEEMERAKRFNVGLAMVMVDIDQFKRLNDEFGHLLGDEVLRQVASIFSHNLRKIDVVCRCGGDEFVILLSQTNTEHAIQVAEKLRRIVETWSFPGVARPVTISAGVAIYPEYGHSRDELMKAADAGMYAAKQAGRNRVCLAPAQQKSAAAQ